MRVGAPSHIRSGNLLLVPKLCLGTPVCETLFRVGMEARNRVSMTCVPKQSLGTRKSHNACRCAFPHQERQPSPRSQTLFGNAGLRNSVSRRDGGSKQSFDDVRSQTEFGNEKITQCVSVRLPKSGAATFSSFPNSVWERRFAKLCFALGWRLETE